MHFKPLFHFLLCSTSPVWGIRELITCLNHQWTLAVEVHLHYALWGSPQKSEMAGPWVHRERERAVLRVVWSWVCVRLTPLYSLCAPPDTRTQLLSSKCTCAKEPLPWLSLLPWIFVDGPSANTIPYVWALDIALQHHWYSRLTLQSKAPLTSSNCSAHFTC